MDSSQEREPGRTGDRMVQPGPSQPVAGGSGSQGKDQGVQRRDKESTKSVIPKPEKAPRVKVTTNIRLRRSEAVAAIAVLAAVLGAACAIAIEAVDTVAILGGIIAVVMWLLILALTFKLFPDGGH